MTYVGKVKSLTNKEKKMGKNTKKIEQLKKIILGNGWEEDRWGNFKKTIDGKEYRYKFQPKTLRRERSYRSADGKKEWMCVRSIYYKNIELQATGFTVIK